MLVNTIEIGNKTKECMRLHGKLKKWGFQEFQNYKYVDFNINCLQKIDK